MVVDQQNAITIDNSNANINSQKIIINNYSNEKSVKSKMRFWNIVFETDKLSDIESLIPTNQESYLIAGQSSANGIYLGELDRNGQEIWSKYFVINIAGGINVNAIALKNNHYCLSYQTNGSNEGRNVILNSHKKVIFDTPTLFYSMVATKSGFVGVTKDTIEHISHDGKKIWKKDLNRKVANLPKHKVVKLLDDSIVEIGKDKDNILWITKYSQEGEILWQKSSSVYQFYLKDVLATSDGGFLILAGRYMYLYKYSSDGEIEWRNNISKYHNVKSTSLLDSVETDNGYILSAYVNKKMLIVKIDFDGNVIWDKVYKSNKNLYAQNIIKALDGGYLVSIDKSISSPWLCKMDKDGKIQTDFNKTNYQNSKITSLGYKSKRSKVDKYLSSNIIKTFGGASRVAISKDENYLYTSSAAGFQISQLVDGKNYRALSRFSKSKTKIEQYSNGAIGPVGRAVKDMTGKYSYNFIRHFIISKDNEKAFILDGNHGFYVLDIKDKKNLKLIKAFDIRGRSFTLSTDQKQIYIAKVVMEQFSLLKIDTESWKLDEIPIVSRNLTLEKPLIPTKRANATTAITFVSPTKAIVSYNEYFMIYNIKTGEIEKQYQTSRSIENIVLSSNKQRAYLFAGKTVELLDLETNEVEEQIYMDEFVSFGDVSQNEKNLYVATSKGAQVIDISNTKEPKVEVIYKNNHSNQLALSLDKKKLYIAFGSMGVGIIDLN
ncbi:MAG: hypothetical protein U9N49_07080 [Campylobacterota bacterium]|nr:hypothetical protein [Campylobacterota bacterium]